MKRLLIFYVLTAALLAPCARAEPEATLGARWRSKSKVDGISEVQRNTYSELARLHACKFTQTTHWHTIDAFRLGKPNPVKALYDLGLDALPFLAEALDDATPTRTVTNCREDVRVWKVSDLVVMVIRRISDREFVIGEWGDGTSLREVTKKPESVAKFWGLIQDWYAQNKGRSVEERKIADLQSNLRNRLDAAMWLGKHKSKKSVPFLTERIETILSGKTASSNTRAELAQMSLALGRVGQPEALASVTRACEHLSHWFYMAYRPSEQGRSGTGSNQRVNLFKAYHGMALLGRKEQALAELRRLLREYGEEMEDSSRKEYEKLLKNAEGWEDTPSNKELKMTR